MITEKDEGRHPAGEGELWNESYYFNFYDDHTRIGGFTRIGLQENINKANVWCLLIKDRKPVYNRFILELPHTQAGMDQGVTVGGLTYKMVEPLKQFQIQFNDRNTQLDLTWKAVHPVKEIGGGSGELPANIASGHYEQGGIVTGTITLKGESYSLEGFGMRDHSWGIRDWEGVKNWMAIWPIFGKDLVIAAIRVTLLDDKVVHTGFIFDGNNNLDIVQVEPKVELVEDQLTQKRLALKVTDEKGQTRDISGNLITNFPLPYDGNLLNEAMFEYQLGERTGYGLFEYNVRL
jgi:hypothetical protein